MTDTIKNLEIMDEIEKEEFAKENARYKVGDEVIYLDSYGYKLEGVISDIEWTEIHEWNKEIKPLYSINNYPYLRGEEQIIKVCDN